MRNDINEIVGINNEEKSAIEENNESCDSYRYPVLRLISIIMRIVGWICLLVGVITLSRSADSSRYAAMEYITIGGAEILAALITIAIGELIKVLIDIEANTRKTAG